jgi:hypothetical protein
MATIACAIGSLESVWVGWKRRGEETLFFSGSDRRLATQRL